jgi:hypothetical protein
LQQHIQKYLIQHQQLSIADWGTMQLVKESAQVDFTNRKIHAPSSKLFFQEPRVVDNSFEKWLADELNISHQDALASIQSFVKSFKLSVSNGTLIWNGWGSFEKCNNNIIFKSAFEVNPGTVNAERVIRKGAEHQIRVGEEERTNTEMGEWLQGTETQKKYLWWIAALILSVFGIILAVLFANNHNIQWKNYSNYHQLQPKEPPTLYKTP